PAAQNVPPHIIDPNPAFGSEVGNPLFQVNVTDLNGGDDLFVLWVSDYPEMMAGTARQLIGDTTRIPAARDATPQVTRISMTFDCKLDFIPGGLERHRI